MSALLAHFQLDPVRVASLDDALGQRVVGFLLRWEAYGEAFACLEAMRETDAAPALLAAALCGLGRTQEAVRAFAPKLTATPGMPARIEWVRLHLAAGETVAARELALELTAGAEGISPAWNLLGDVYLAEGQLDAAESLFLHQARLAPASHTAQLGLMRVQWRRAKLVAAAAYAVRALDLAERGAELTPAELGELRALFTASDDANRAHAVNRRLIAAYDRDVAALQAALADVRRRSPAPEGAEDSPPLPGPPQPAPEVAAIGAPSPIAVAPQQLAAMQQAVRELFGYPELRPNQAEVLACVQQGEHVLAVLPTGAGKSLCYQLPAFQDQGVTLVVSPLIALMKNQLDGLPGPLRQQAVAVNSSLDGDELRRTVERIAARHYRLVYVAPERLRQLPFVDALRRAGVARLVIDEAHCVSIWGHDFRPDYLHLAQTHRDLGSPPILAMTATAPPRVRQDIEQQLLGRSGGMRVLVGDTFRANLLLTARRLRDDDERMQACVDIVRTLVAPGPPGTRSTPKPTCGIVYARTRQRCEEVAAALRTAGVNAAHYHAGIENRVEIQDRFMRSDIPVIVATVAFGMGVDKPDIRFIVHHGLPDSVEGYYQEIGRAGRDGAAAHCVLLHTYSDHTLLARLAGNGQLSVDQARGVYRAVRGTLGNQTIGSTTLAALARQTQLQENTVRMALSLLEQVGVLRRHCDVPVSVSVQRLPQRQLRAGDPACDEFLRRIGLHARTVAAGDFADLASASGLPANLLEGQLLSWQADARIRYQPQGRMLMLELLTPPANASQYVESLVSQRAAIAEQRVKEITDFARTDQCRHIYLAHYLGGQRAGIAGAARRKQCGACDNCGAGMQQAAPSPPAGHSAAATLVLAALAEQSWGKRTLVRLLRGDPAAPLRAQQSSVYAALRERSEQSLHQLVESLLNEQLVAARELDHGGVTLELTSRGRKALQQGSAKSNRPRR